MLKSTYKPSPNVLPPLLPGWTEHKAPTGHTYYYNANTKESTYKRPGVDVPPSVVSQPQPPPPPSQTAAALHDPNASYFQYSAVPNLSDPAAANAFLAQYDPTHQRQQQQQQQQYGRGGGGGHRGGHGNSEGRDGGGRPRPQPNDKPRSKVAIPGCEPWILVYTKYGRRFVYNPVKNQSYWRIPEKVMKGILELDIKGIKEKAGGGGGGDDENGGSGEGTSKSAEAQKIETEKAQREEELEELGSDYEEVEVTDDEGEGEGEEGDGDNENAEGDEEGGGHRAKRQRTEEAGTGTEEQEEEDDANHNNNNMPPVEFDEDDIAYQLQAMGADYGLDPGEYDDGDAEAWPEGAEGNPLSDADACALFEDLLDDHGINPYSPWDKLLEEGRVFDDPRYTALATTKARRAAWEGWSRARIRALRARRAREEQRDPRIPFLAFLHDKATSAKLYWAEFRRKHRKEGPAAMRDSTLSDRERERLYREHVARLRLPLEARKKDLLALLRGVPLRSLNRRTPVEDLPAEVLADGRFAGLDTPVRDQLVEAYIQTLPGPPEEGEATGDGEGERKKRDEKRKRETALRERERVVAEDKKRQRRALEHGRAALREEEREIQRAMNVGKKGLQSQLEAAREKEKEKEKDRGKDKEKEREAEAMETEA